MFNSEQQYIKKYEAFFFNKSYYSPLAKMLLKLAANVLTYISQTLLWYWIFISKCEKKEKKKHRADSEYNKNKKKTIQQSALSMQNVPSQRLMSETKVPLVMSG